MKTPCTKEFNRTLAVIETLSDLTSEIIRCVKKVVNGMFCTIKPARGLGQLIDLTFLVAENILTNVHSLNLVIFRTEYNTLFPKNDMVLFIYYSSRGTLIFFTSKCSFFFKEQIILFSK